MGLSKPVRPAGFDSRRFQAKWGRSVGTYKGSTIMCTWNQSPDRAGQRPSPWVNHPPGDPIAPKSTGAHATERPVQCAGLSSRGIMQSVAQSRQARSVMVGIGAVPLSRVWTRDGSCVVGPCRDIAIRPPHGHPKRTDVPQTECAKVIRICRDLRACAR